MGHRLLPLLALAAALLQAAPAAAQRSPLTIATGGPALEWRPVVRVQNLLRDRALTNALHSGLPLRLHVRVELWENQLFDRLVGGQDAFLALSYDPLERGYRLDACAAPSNDGDCEGALEQRYATLADAEAAIGTTLVVPLRPRGRERYYYLATLEVETLSLSDLEELQRWLRGEVRPAVAGRAPVGRAVERGVRRLLVRTIGLPTRRYEARTRNFTPR